MAREAAALSPLPSHSPDQEAFELSTTVDPSYIIHLIRLLLQSVHMREQPCEKDKEDVTEPVLGQTGQEKQAEQCDDRVTTVREDMDSCKSVSVEVEAGTCEIPNVPSERASNDMEGSEPAERSRNEMEGSELPLKQDKFQAGGQSTPRFEVLSCKEDESIATLQVLEEQREEAGCTLWDLAATQSHAEFMVRNHILDVLLAVLGVPYSDRLREICLGILGNLACHAEPVKAIVQTSLPNEIVQSLFVDDAPSLSEACRLLSASLHSEQVDSWVKAIDSQEVLERVLWIAANTMNSLLLEKLTLKSTELLLAMVDCQGSTASVLLSSLVHLGLPAVLTDLLASEISAFNEGTCSHGNVVLDTTLQIAEVLSLDDDVAGELADNSKLFTLACQVIGLSGRDEVGPAGISATVLVANLLAEKEDLIHEVAQDVVLIKQLLELLPSVCDDPGARNALWSILGRLSLANSTAYSKGSTAATEVVLAFAQGCNTILEDLQDHQELEEPEEAENSRGYTAKLETVGSFLHMMEDWMVSHDSASEDKVVSHDTASEDKDIYKTVSDSCRALEGWRKSMELDEKWKHGGKHMSLQNGVRIE